MEPAPARDCVVLELKRKVRLQLVECGKLERMREVRREKGMRGQGREVE